MRLTVSDETYIPIVQPIPLELNLGPIKVKNMGTCMPYILWHIRQFGSSEDGQSSPMIRQADKDDSCAHAHEENMPHPQPGKTRIPARFEPEA